jgi:flagellin
MSLGVLNNLSALYAENNLNNSNNSLNTVLQQLSSGSKINSGADDAAGLSLVNGLQANSMALTQSETNATEGVGLLQVADGALSQVTSLLNRAVTLATEASNGTLNSSQDTAANQEYQSILSEINNIGTTTTYNQQAVFGAGSPVNIYTGDSSTAGASVDSLNIRTLSSSNVGDSGGVMAYSNGANNVFLNLSSSTANAAATDYLAGGATGTTTLQVNYMVKGATGTSSTASTQIVVGQGTNYGNTANGLMSAINNSGLGLTASFTTQAGAGVQGGGTQTGIQISGGLVSAGVDPNAASTNGMLNAAGIPASELLTNGQTVTVSEGGAVKATVIIGTTANVNGIGTVNTLGELSAKINNLAGAGTASIVTNGDGSQSLALADNSSTGGAMTVTTQTGSGPVTPVFSNNTPGSATTLLAAYGTAVTGNVVTPATQGAVTFGVSRANLATDTLSAGGSITLTNSATNTALTFVVGAGTNTATKFYTANNTVSAGNTLGDLAEAIHEQATALGADSSVGGGGITVTAATAQTNLNITASVNSLTNANATIGLYNPTDGGVAVAGSDTVTALDAGASTLATDVLNTGGVITLSNGDTGQNFTYVATAGQKISDLVTAIGASNLGVTATFSGGAILMTSTAKGANPITVVGTNTLQDTTVTGSPSVAIDAANAGTVVGVPQTPATNGTAVLQLDNGGTITDATDQLTGQILLKNGAAATQTIIMGAGTSSGNTIYTGAYTVNSLLTAIDGDATLGMTAVAGGNGAGSLGSIYLQSTATGTAISNPAGVNTLADAVAITPSAPVNGVTAVAGQDSVTTVGTVLGGLSTTDQLAAGGTIVLANSATPNNTANQYTFTVGTGNSNVTVGNTTTLAAGSTLADLATAISGITNLGVTATATTNGLNLTSTNFDANQIKVIGTPTMADATQGSPATDTLGTFASANDTISGTLAFTGGNGAQSITLAAGTTVQSLVNQIHAGKATYGVDATLVNGANGAASILLTSTTESGTISNTGSTSIADTASTANLSWTQGAAYNTGISGSVGDSTTSQSAASFVSDASGGKGTATISYTDGAGQSLSASDLSNQTDAQTALNQLNSAITDVAAQDGYIGAQINTLNSVSQVLSTQQENVVSAQNAVQATDYATATSNMSKYEILSQTGIAALAQANSMQQEVTKLLQ